MPKPTPNNGSQMRNVQEKKFERKAEERHVYNHAPKPHNIPKPASVEEKSDGFVSLKDMKQKSNNQRPASEKNISDLKNALSSIVKPVKPEKPKEVIQLPKLEARQSDTSGQVKKVEEKKGPTPEELKALLND